MKPREYHGCAGKNETVEYRSWRAMRERCGNPNNSAYARYGGRGISVCKRWQSFSAFLSDMGHKPSPSHSLDRIEPDGNYSPENCRWATQKQQVRNSTTPTWITHNGKTRTLGDWAKEVGVSIQTIINRRKAGWSVPEMLSPRYAYKRGERHSSSKLTEAQVRSILSRCDGSTDSVKELAVEHGVTPQQIRAIHKGKAWKHIQREGNQAKEAA